MNANQLTEEQKILLNTDFGDFEKEAEARLEVVQEMYAYGHEKLAKEIAEGVDEMHKEMAEKDQEAKDDAEEKMDAESEKAAAEMGAFIERGVFDGLAKLGSERYDDPMFYFYPFIEDRLQKTAGVAILEKVGMGPRVGTGTPIGLRKAKFGQVALSKAKGMLEKGKRAVKGRLAADKAKLKGAGADIKRYGTMMATGKGARGKDLTEIQKAYVGKKTKGAAGQAAKTIAPYAAAGTGAAVATGAGAKKVYQKIKGEENEQ